MELFEKLNRYKVKAKYKKIILLFIDFILFIILKHRRAVPKEVNSILVIRVDNLGDILLTRPLLFSLKKNYPNAKLDVLIKSKAVNVLANDSWINKVFFYEEFNIKQARKYKYDLIIEPKGRLDYAFLSWRLRPNFSIGFGDAGGGAFFNKVLYQVDQDPIIKNQLICNSLNVSYISDFPDLVVSKELQNKYETFKNYIVLAPYTSRIEKDWGIENFVLLARKLSSKGFKIIFLVEKQKEEMFAGSLANSFQYLAFSKNQLFDYFAVIKSCFLFISSDSAGIHVAATVKTESIAIYGPENPGIWHPYDNNINHYIERKHNSDLDIIDFILKLLEEKKTLNINYLAS